MPESKLPAVTTAGLPVAKTASPCAPTPLTKTLDRLMSAIGNHLEPHPAESLKFEISARFAPSSVEREVLAGRHLEVASALLPGGCDPEDVEDHLVLLFTACNAFGASEREAAAKAGVYALCMDEFPGWAIKAACVRMAKAKHETEWNGKGIPSTNEIIAEIKHVLLPWRAEEYRIRKILTAEIFGEHTTQAERDANIIEFRKAMAGIRREGGPDLDRDLPSDQEKLNARKELQERAASLRGQAGADPLHGPQALDRDTGSEAG